MRLFNYFFLIVIIGCSQPKPEVTKNKLSGYWEIQSVVLVDGIKKDFSFNPIVDFKNYKYLITYFRNLY